MKKLSFIFLILSVILLISSCQTPEGGALTEDHVHEMSDWTVINEPTCVAEGLKESVCECGYRESEAIPTVDHLWSEGSCTEPSICEYCGYAPEAASGHKCTANTCFATCESCGEIIENTTAHSYNSDAICIYCGNYAPVGPYIFRSNGDGTCVLVNGGAYNVHAVIPSVSPDGDTVIGIEGAFMGSSCLRSVVIPDTVTFIGYQSFANCGGLLEVTIPDSVVEIGYGAFAGCNKVAEFDLPDRLEHIGEGAFALCVFDELVIPDSVTVIDKFAFERTTISTLTIGRGLQTVKDYGFLNATIQKVIAPNLSLWCKIDFTTQRSNPLLPPEFSDHIVDFYVGDELLTDLVIPNDIIEIKQYTFDHCQSLKTVVIPDHVTKISDYSFANCFNVEVVRMGDGVETLGTHSFSYCTSLKDLKLSSRLKIITCAFMYCTSLEKVDIPDSVELIEREAFYNCTELKTLILGKGLKEIGIASFGWCPLNNIYYVGNGIEFQEVIIPDYYLNFSHDQVECSYTRPQQKVPFCKL